MKKKTSAIGEIFMYSLKLDFSSCEEQLVKELQAISNDRISVLKSDGLFGNTEIIVAIIAATPVILTQVAKVIQTYLEKNKSKSFTLKINGEEMSFTVFFNCDSKIVIQSSGEKSVPTLDISKNL